MKIFFTVIILSTFGALSAFADCPVHDKIKGEIVVPEGKCAPHQALICKDGKLIKEPACIKK